MNKELQAIQNESIYLIQLPKGMLRFHVLIFFKKITKMDTIRTAFAAQKK